jgi:hypothetical protein
MKDNYELDSGNVNMSAEGKAVGYNMFGDGALTGKDQQRIDGVMMGSGNVPQFGGDFATQKHSVGMPQQQSTPPPMPDGGKGAVVTGSENFATTTHQPGMPSAAEHGNASGYTQSPEDMFPTGQPKPTNIFKKKEGGTDVGNALRSVKKFFQGRDNASMKQNIVGAGGKFDDQGNLTFDPNAEGANLNKMMRKANRFNSFQTNQGNDANKIDLSSFGSDKKGKGLFKSAKPGGSGFGNLLRNIF